MIPVSSSPSIQQGSFTYDPDFKGPVKKRKCTDVLCLFVFVSFLSGWAVIAYFGFRYGDPNKLIYPTDSEGNICGIHKFSAKPHLYFFNILECSNPSVVLKGCPTHQVCVSDCPNETFMLEPSTDNIESFKDKLICKYDADMNLSVKELINTGTCASMYLKSKPLLGRCIPQDLFLHAGMIIDAVTNDTAKTVNGAPITKEALLKASKFLAEFYNLRALGEKLFGDLKVAWKQILVMLCFSMIGAFIWIVLMRFVAGIMVWLSLIAAVSLDGYVFYYSVTKYMGMKNIEEEKDNLTKSFSLNLSSYFNSKSTWLFIAIVSGVLLLILIVITIFLRKRIRIAIALIEEASKAVAAMPLTLFFPFIPYLVQLLNFGFWIAVALYIASSTRTNFVVENADSKSKLQNDTSCDPTKFDYTYVKCVFKKYDSTSGLQAAQVYNFFAFLWNTFFWNGIAQVAIAYVFASYYWTFHKSRDTKWFAIISGFWCTFRYHLGSIAMGSLLLATLKFVRVALEYIDHKVKKYDNSVTRCISWCLRCCFFCLEKFLQLISKNAYIMIATLGESFCSSAKTAFDLLLRNAIRVVVLDRVTGFLFFIGEITIVSGTAVASFYVFSGRIEAVKTDLHYYAFPVLIVTIITFFITQVFFSVYGMAVDTIFLCFLEDLERNDGSPEKPYYMSKELMKILNKSNKFREPEK